jgi:hypothetical protein
LTGPEVGSPAAATVTIADDDPAIAVTPTNLNFGPVAVDSMAALAFTVRNIGAGTLNGSLTGVSPPYSIVSGGTYSLAAGTSSTVTVSYNPTSVGTHTQNVTFAGGGGMTCSLMGRAYVPWDDGAVPAVGGWVWIEWFGYCNWTFHPWILHETHGALCCIDDTYGGVWLYDPHRNAWWWTSPSAYALMWYYDGVSGQWLWYAIGTANPRWFFNLATGLWEDWQP